MLSASGSYTVNFHEEALDCMNGTPKLMRRGSARHHVQSYVHSGFSHVLLIQYATTSFHSFFSVNILLCICKCIFCGVEQYLNVKLSITVWLAHYLSILYVFHTPTLCLCTYVFYK